MSETLTIDPDQKALTISGQAQAVTVCDQASLDSATWFLSNVIKSALEGAEIQLLNRAVASANESHKDALKARNAFVVPLQNAEKYVKHQIGTYLAAEEQKRQEQERKIRQEEERRQREQEQETRRLQAIADREHELQIEAEIQEAEELHVSLADIEHIIKRPAPVVSIPAVFTPLPMVAPTVQKPAGIGLGTLWSARVKDLRKLAAAVGSGDQPEALIIGLALDPDNRMLSSPALNQLARALKSDLAIPGVESWWRPNISMRRK